MVDEEKEKKMIFIAAKSGVVPNELYLVLTKSYFYDVNTPMIWHLQACKTYANKEMTGELVDVSGLEIAMFKYTTPVEKAYVDGICASLNALGEGTFLAWLATGLSR